MIKFELFSIFLVGFRLSPIFHLLIRCKKTVWAKVVSYMSAVLKKNNHTNKKMRRDNESQLKILLEVQDNSLQAIVSAYFFLELIWGAMFSGFWATQSPSCLLKLMCKWLFMLQWFYISFYWSLFSELFLLCLLTD